MLLIITLNLICVSIGGWSKYMRKLGRQRSIRQHLSSVKLVMYLCI